MENYGQTGGKYGKSHTLLSHGHHSTHVILYRMCVPWVKRLNGMKRDGVRGEMIFPKQNARAKEVDLQQQRTTDDDQS